MNTNVFRDLNYGVYVVTSLDGKRPTGCIANSVMQITSSPASIAVSMNHDNFTNSCIKESGYFAVSILSQESDPSIIGAFGFQSGKSVNKFDNYDFKYVETMPIIKDACSYIVCKVVNQMETSTHTVFLGEVVACDVLKKKNPMSYAYYHEVVKGKSPKNAPTYIPEDESVKPNKDYEENSKETIAEEAVEDKKEMNQYKCEICGYIYEGESLPESYRCPICGQGTAYFKKVE